jgi:hypothetical protein
MNSTQNGASVLSPPVVGKEASQGPGALTRASMIFSTGVSPERLALLPMREEVRAALKALLQAEPQATVFLHAACDGSERLFVSGDHSMRLRVCAGRSEITSARGVAGSDRPGY